MEVAGFRAPWLLSPTAGATLLPPNFRGQGVNRSRRQPPPPPLRGQNDLGDQRSNTTSWNRQVRGEAPRRSPAPPAASGLACRARHHAAPRTRRTSGSTPTRGRPPAPLPGPTRPYGPVRSALGERSRKQGRTTPDHLSNSG